MKKYTLSLLLPLLLCLANCKKDDDQHTNPVDQLPPATQTGAGTFAALVDGKPFIDKSGGWFNCYYQYVDEEYYFGISGSRGNNNSLRPQYLYIQTEKKEIFEGETYALIELEEGNAYGGGGGGVYSPTEGYIRYTNSKFTGELTITKLDFEKQIVSGVFWFDLEHPETGERVKIREGRFDTLFTQ